MSKKITGRKDDQNKAPVTQFLRQFPKALTYTSRVSEYGHSRYGQEENDEYWDNWKYVENALFRYKQAAGRHFLEVGGKIDESGFKHISHTIWNLLAVLELEIEREEKKSKKKKDKKKKKSKKKKK